MSRYEISVWLLKVAEEARRVACSSFMASEEDTNFEWNNKDLAAARHYAALYFRILKWIREDESFDLS